jgi:hypothetical protein
MATIDAIARNFLLATWSLFITALLLVLFFITAKAQNSSLTDGATPLGIAPGAPAGSYALSGFDNINLYNGNLNFRLQLMQVGGRGGTGYTMTLPIERHWHVERVTIDANPPHGAWFTRDYPVADLGYWDPTDAMRYGPGRLIGRGVGTNFLDCSGGQGQWGVETITLTRLTFIAPDGTQYELRDQLTGGMPLRNNQCLIFMLPREATCS